MSEYERSMVNGRHKRIMLQHLNEILLQVADGSSSKYIAVIRRNTAETSYSVNLYYRNFNKGNGTKELIKTIRVKEHNEDSKFTYEFSFDVTTDRGAIHEFSYSSKNPDHIEVAEKDGLDELIVMELGITFYELMAKIIDTHNTSYLFNEIRRLRKYLPAENEEYKVV